MIDNELVLILSVSSSFYLSVCFDLQLPHSPLLRLFNFSIITLSKDSLLSLSQSYSVATSAISFTYKLTGKRRSPQVNRNFLLYSLLFHFSVCYFFFVEGPSEDSHGISCAIRAAVKPWIVNRYNTVKE